MDSADRCGGVEGHALSVNKAETDTCTHQKCGEGVKALNDLLQLESSPAHTYLHCSIEQQEKT